jgi:glycosyltransferase involved in cell wall biosynthesis
MLFSICIPTYNRPEQLRNCLNSIAIAKKKIKIDFEVCISDNCSDFNINKIIKNFKPLLNIKFNQNKKNLGFALNLLKVISIAKGEFVWTIGDDDLLTTDSIKSINHLILNNLEVDFFYINSYHLNSDYLKKFATPFNTHNLPKKMEKMSQLSRDKKCNFWDLIDYNVSFDFLLGIYLCVFRRSKWIKNRFILDRNLIKDNKVWSNFDNTCPHIKIFANAYKHSKAYFFSKPLSVNLFGVREWGKLYPFIEIVRMPEMLDYYRSCGLNFYQYIYNKNYSLRNFSNYFTKIFFMGKEGGKHYISIWNHVIKNLLYPNVYFSIFYFLLRKLKLFNKI